jgi:hypothetical protein
MTFGNLILLAKLLDGNGLQSAQRAPAMVWRIPPP